MVIVEHSTEALAPMHWLRWRGMGIPRLVDLQALQTDVSGVATVRRVLRAWRSSNASATNARVAALRYAPLRCNSAAVRCGSAGSSLIGYSSGFSCAIAAGRRVASRLRRTISMTALIELTSMAIRCRPQKLRHPAAGTREYS
jgi:hypothetical protein